MSQVNRWFVLLFVVAAACKYPALPNLGAEIDAQMEGAIDASAGDAAGPVFKGYDADEGGEVRAEYITFSNGTVGARILGYLYKNPGTTKYFPFPNLNGCTDMTDLKHWPMATNPLAERTYMDPGGITISGGAMPLSLPRAAANTDYLYRAHSANNWFFYFNPTDGANYLASATKQTVAFGGSADMPAQTFTDVLFTPPAFNLINPPGTTPIPAIPIAAGTAQTFTWSVPAVTPPTGYSINSLVAFTGAAGPAILCIEPNDGVVTVPATMIDIARAKYPAGGTLVRQTLTHVTRELVDRTGKTGRRIDFISIWCFATGFTVP